MQRTSCVARQVLRWSAFLSLPGALWAALEMYGLTMSGPQMLFFSIVHTMPLLVLAVRLAVPTGVAWLAQSALALAWPKYRSLVRISVPAAATFTVALGIQAVLLATYEEWSYAPSARIPLCMLGLVATAALVRQSWLALRGGPTAAPSASSASDA